MQIVDRYVIKPDGILEYVSISLYSLEYPIDFMILTPHNNLGGHPLILARPWLATTDAFLSCRSGDTFISNGNSTKKFTLYPLEKVITEIERKVWIEDDDEYFENIQPIFTISQID